MVSFPAVAEAIATAYGLPTSIDEFVASWESVHSELSKDSGLYFETISAREAAQIKDPPATSFRAILLKAMKSCLRTVRLHQEPRGDPRRGDPPEAAGGLRRARAVRQEQLVLAPNGIASS